MDKKEIIYKQKIVNFKLSSSMSMPQMIKLNYRRPEIEYLFQKLQDDGYGEYIKGTRGRSGCAKFNANDKCPQIYEISFKQNIIVKEKQKNYFGTISKEEYEATKDTYKSKIEEILSIERNPTSVPFKDGSGYVCSTACGYLFVDRVSNGGFDSIALALDDIWNDIKVFVSAKGTKEMTPQEEVESNLMGFHFYKLLKEDKPEKRKKKINVKTMPLLQKQDK